MKLGFLMLLLISADESFSASVDTILIYSASMHGTKKCVVIKPDGMTASRKYNTVYMLHGYAGDFSDWIKKVPKVKEACDKYQELIVCPDGDFSSWYLDSPVDPSMKYETYISTEVPEYIDAHYPTNKERGGRAITGLSMGGTGALFIAFRHSDFFGACGSMSGCMDLNFIKNKFDAVKRLGDTIHHAANWEEYSLLHIIEVKPEQPLSVIMDCGLDDFFYPGNAVMHQKMLKLKIPHDFTERPGRHEWSYWANSVQYHLLYFYNYFQKENITHAKVKI